MAVEVGFKGGICDIFISVDVLMLVLFGPFFCGYVNELMLILFGLFYLTSGAVFLCGISCVGLTNLKL